MTHAAAHLDAETVEKYLATLGFSSEPAYKDLYCERRGLSGIPIFGFALAFSFFRMAAIVQGVLKRGLDGAASNPDQALARGRCCPSGWSAQFPQYLPPRARRVQS